MNTNEKNCTVKPALVTTSIEQQLVLRDLNFKITIAMPAGRYVGNDFIPGLKANSDI
jgi:hypothetical protein